MKFDFWCRYEVHAAVMSCSSRGLKFAAGSARHFLLTSQIENEMNVDSRQRTARDREMAQENTKKLFFFSAAAGEKMEEKTKKIC